jgi:putative DNA primase/helicase
MRTLNDTKASALGKWLAILKHYGFTDKQLSGQHGPCPMCEGKDRFRYTDYKSNGDYYCSGCGAGSGFDLVMWKLDCEFAHAAKEIDKFLGVNQVKPVFAPRVDKDKRIRDLNSLWKGAKEFDLVLDYLAVDRGLVFNEGDEELADIRGHGDMFLAGSNQRHAGMLALIRSPDGVPISIHRTYIGERIRKVMPPIESITGGAIRLGAPTADALVIGEGIETTLSGMRHCGHPGYACISAHGMENVVVPPTVSDVIILADNDNSFTGQKAAFTLARRMDQDEKTVTVLMPINEGEDFNDLDLPLDDVDILEWSNG